MAEVQPGMPAAQAGLHGGDAIEAVDGHAFHYVNTLLAYMQAEKGKPMTLTVLRQGATLSIVATPEKLDTRYMLGFSTTPTPIRDEPLSLVSAAGQVHWASSGIMRCLWARCWTGCLRTGSRSHR